jgi:nitrilase
VAAVQAAPVLMDREATLARVADLTRSAAADGAELVVFPEAFVPGPPVWIDTARIWDGDDEWYGVLADQAVVVPGPATARLGDIARGAGVWLVVGVDERDGGTIYNTLLYLAPDGTPISRQGGPLTGERPRGRRGRRDPGAGRRRAS